MSTIKYLIILKNVDEQYRRIYEINVERAHSMHTFREPIQQLKISITRVREVRNIQLLRPYVCILPNRRVCSRATQIFPTKWPLSSRFRFVYSPRTRYSLSRRLTVQKPIYLVVVFCVMIQNAIEATLKPAKQSHITPAPRPR